jgi:hypothetical protein
MLAACLFGKDWRGLGRTAPNSGAIGRRLSIVNVRYALPAASSVIVVPADDARSLIIPAAASSLSNRLARVELMPSLLPSARSLVRRTPAASATICVPLFPMKLRSLPSS